MVVVPVVVVTTEDKPVVVVKRVVPVVPVVPVVVKGLEEDEDLPEAEGGAKVKGSGSGFELDEDGSMVVVVTDLVFSNYVGDVGGNTFVSGVAWR